MMPYGRVFIKPPQRIRLSRIQFRLAIELGAQGAAVIELKRQLAQQIGIPEGEIGIDGASIDFTLNGDPEIGMPEGVAVEWVD